MGIHRGRPQIRYIHKINARSFRAGKVRGMNTFGFAYRLDTMSARRADRFSLSKFCPPV